MVYKKSVGILLFNSSGELALQFRAAHDDSYPAHWDFSCGGGVDEGEEPTDAAIREAYEEIGATITPQFVSTHQAEYPQWGTSETKHDDMSIFRAFYEGPFELDPNEVADIKWFALSDVASMLSSGEKIHPAFRSVWEAGLVR